MDIRSCRKCKDSFELSPEDAAFLEKLRPTVAGQRLPLPEPSLCAPCRRQQRYALRNDTHLYKRKCSKTGRDIISIYSEEKPFPVYAIDVWYSDAYDPLQYGRDVDFSRPFFEQLAALAREVPRPASTVVSSDNCDYTAFTLQSRNCFLTSRLMGSEDIYYSYLAINSRNCLDSYDVNNCELCYETIHCNQCYNCVYTERSKGCHDLYFCADMSGCSDCFGCVGLKQKQYYFFNQPLSPEAYKKKLAEWMPSTPESWTHCIAAFTEHQKKYPVRALSIFNSENTFGSNVYDSRNAWMSFDMVECEDVRYCTQSERCKDLMDSDFSTKAEFSYSVLSNGACRALYFCYAVIGGSNDLFYCMESYNVNQNCFGCVGLKKNSYCILNKQYSKEEYEALVLRLVEHMQKTGEWGQYFPAALSNVGYNESCAMLLKVLNKEEALAEGYSWHDMQESAPVQAEGENMVKCSETGRVFRLIPQELAFYKQLGLPRPSVHPDVRHQARLRRLLPYELHTTNCRKCGTTVWTDQKEDSLIYCIDCYLREVY